MSELAYFPPGDVFIETGTGDGITLKRASGHYTSCLSIEFDYNTYLENCKRFALAPNVRLYYGNSEEMLLTLLPFFYQHHAVFWLDAHCTDACCPLLKELRSILNVPWDWTPKIFIDDFNGFQGNIPGWPRIEEIDALMSGWKRSMHTDYIFTYER